MKPSTISSHLEPRERRLKPARVVNNPAYNMYWGTPATSQSNRARVVDNVLRYRRRELVKKRGLYSKRFVCRILRVVFGDVR